MSKRSRTIPMQIYLSVDELKLVNTKMLQLGTRNFSAYARKMLIDGYVVKKDFSDMKKLVGELAAIGRNINQLAKRANETRNIYEQDIADLKRDYSRITGLINERLVKIIKSE